MSRSKTLDDASFEPHKAKTKKKSLGALYRVAKRTNPRAPHMTGVMSIQRDLIKQLVGDLRETDANEVKCQLAGWPNIDKKRQAISDDRAIAEIPGKPARWRRLR